MNSNCFYSLISGNNNTAKINVKYTNKIFQSRKNDNAQTIMQTEKCIQEHGNECID
jgi:hypothetical protein